MIAGSTYEMEGVAQLGLTAHGVFVPSIPPCPADPDVPIWAARRHLRTLGSLQKLDAHADLKSGDQSRRPPVGRGRSARDPFHPPQSISMFALRPRRHQPTVISCQEADVREPARGHIRSRV